MFVIADSPELDEAVSVEEDAIAKIPMVMSLAEKGGLCSLIVSFERNPPGTGITTKSYHSFINQNPGNVQFKEKEGRNQFNMVLSHPSHFYPRHSTVHVKL